jgi:hypothetical protein
MKLRNAIGAVAAAALALAAAVRPAQAQHDHPARPGGASALAIPEPMAIEHEAIHARLEAATLTAGAVGAAARELAAVLGPHFTRENQVALPPLSLLAPLARGETIPGPAAAAALAMSDTLRAELPRMLEEHVRIRAAAERLEAVARTHADQAAEELAHELQGHARMEEEIHYPAAVLVGTLLRHR